MALVVLLKGINVGGHRRFRPSTLASDLAELDVVNVGAAGTFVVREPIGRSELRAAIESRLPFEAEMVICTGADISRLVSLAPFAGHRPTRDVVQFVSAMARGGTSTPPDRLTLPEAGAWGLKVLVRHGQFLVGLHRRDMKAIGHLTRLEALVGAPLVTRGWPTVLKIERLVRA